MFLTSLYHTRNRTWRFLLDIELHIHHNTSEDSSAAFYERRFWTSDLASAWRFIPWERGDADDAVYTCEPQRYKNVWEGEEEKTEAMIAGRPCAEEWLETGQHEQFQAYVKVAHIDDFEKIGLHADFGELLDDGSGLLGETEVDVTTVAHDALKSDARLWLQKSKPRKYAHINSHNIVYLQVQFI
uniref:Uncharacterized protein n=1 Tax=Salix viminalis TaxID=40686 RepID=A0A6N2NLK4_SALVM